MNDLSPARHEKRDVNTLGLLISTVVLTAAVVVAFFVAWWAFDYLSAREKSKSSIYPLAEQNRGRLPPEPRLEEINRLEGRKHMRPRGSYAENERVLESYEWVDEKAGVARIPISRAMRIIVDNNLLPARHEARRQQERRPSAANSGRALGRDER